MAGPLEMKIIVASEDDLRRIVREEIAAQKVTVQVTADREGMREFVRQPRPGFRFTPDGQGGLAEEPIPSSDLQDRT